MPSNSNNSRQTGNGGSSNSGKIIGGDGDDFLLGTNGADEFRGGDGDDIIVGNGGTDTVFGNDGYDIYQTTETPIGHEILQDKNTWSIRSAATGNVSTLKHIEAIAFGGDYLLSLLGDNNSPYTKDILADVLEDSAIEINLAAAAWDLEDTLTYSAQTQSAHGASVTVTSDGTLTYVPVEHFSGVDTVTFTVWDGIAGHEVERTLTINVEAVADAPTLAMVTGATGNVNEVSLVVSTALIDTDGSETGTFVFAGLPNEVQIIDNTGKDVSTAKLSIADSSQHFTLVLPPNVDSNFDLRVEATATEILNGDSATTALSTSVSYNVADSQQSVAFTSTGQNMWGTGNAYNEFFSFTSELVSVDVAEDLVRNSWTVGPATLDASLYAYASFDASLYGELGLVGGSLDAEISYDLSLSTAHNQTTDTLSISTTALSGQAGGFTTSGPESSFSAGLAVSGQAGVEANIGASIYWYEPHTTWKSYTVKTFLGNYKVWYPSISWHKHSAGDSDSYEDVTGFNEALPLLDISSDDVNFETDLPKLIDFGSIASDLTALDTASSTVESGVFTSSGESGNLLDMQVNLDKFLEFAGYFRPLDLDVSISGSTIDVLVDPLDLSIGASVHLEQDFGLEPGAVIATLLLEDGTELAYTPGDTLVLENASQYDLNDDGNIDVQLLLQMNANFENNTDLVLDANYAIELYDSDFNIVLDGVSVVDADPSSLYKEEQETEVASIDVYDNVFEITLVAELVAVPIDYV